MIDMTDEDIRTLESIPALMLAEWWCLLNTFGWPEGLKNPEQAMYTPNGRTGQIMRWIMGRIGTKECLREWNRAEMAGATFDEWWNRRNR